MAKDVKPPPIVVAPEGFVDSGFARLARPRLEQVAGLPAFQRFMQERESLPVGMPADRFALERAREALQQDPDFLVLYEQWHQAQGLWPNETPYGQLIEDTGT